MLRLFAVGFALFSCSAASRIVTHEAANTEVTKAEFGASCDELQTLFRNHLTQVAALQAAHQEEQVSRTTQVRFSMRAFRIIRTLRRARTCSWVTDSDSDDIQQVQALAQTFLASNPCAPVARAELEAGTNPETEEVEVATVNRALQILIAEDCEVLPENSAGTDEPMSDEEIVSMVRAAEEEGENRVDELLEESEGTNGVFIQSDSGTFHSFMRRLGAVFLALLMILACVSGAGAIVALIAFAVTNIFFYQLTGCGVGQRCGYAFVPFWTTIGAAAGALIGLPGCSSLAYRVLSPN